MNTLSKKATKFAKVARARFGKLTPFRLGLVVGEAGDAIRVPWSDKHSRSLFSEGRRYGEDMRKRHAAQGTEARRAETPKSGSVHDGPVAKRCAPMTPPNSHQG